MIPADESLRARKPGRVCLNVIFWLIIYLELSCIQGMSQLTYKTLFIILTFIHALIIYDQMLLIVTAGHVAGSPRHIKLLHGLELLPVSHHPHAESDVYVRRQFIHPCLEPVKNLLIIISVPAIDIEAVSFKSSRYPIGFLRDRYELIPDSAEYLVSHFPSMERIDRMELFYIEDDRIHGYLRMVSVHLFRVLEEIFPIIQTREVICFCCGDKELRPLCRAHVLHEQNRYHKQHDCYS